MYFATKFCTIFKKINKTFFLSLCTCVIYMCNIEIFSHPACQFRVFFTLFIYTNLNILSLTLK